MQIKVLDLYSQHFAQWWAGGCASTPHVLHASHARGLRCRTLYGRSSGARVSAHGAVALQRWGGLI